MNPSFYSLFMSVLLTLSYFHISAQNIKGKHEQKIDSLRAEFKNARTDTAKIRLRYYIGTTRKVTRVSYWDSLIVDAHRYSLPLFEGRAYYQKGYLFIVQSQKAEECFNKSVLIAEKAGNKMEAISTLKNISTVYRLKSDLKKALDYCYQGLKIAEQLKSEIEIASFRSLLGDIYFQAGDFQKALDLHLSCLNVFEKLNIPDRIAWEIITVGADYDSMRDTTNACRYYLLGLKHISQSSPDKLVLNLYNSAAAAYGQKKEYDSAFYYSKKSLEISRRLNDKTNMASSLTTLSYLSLWQSDFKTAKKTAIAAMKFADSIGFLAQIPLVAEVLKQVYLAEKDYKKALEAYELYINIKDSIYNEKKRKQVLEKEFAYNLDKKESENKLLAQQNQIQTLQLSQNKFFLFGLGCLLLLVLVIAYLFIRQNKLQTKQQTTQLEQKLLLSQMNPHFIFNSLQAIQNFILKHQGKEAVKYLSSFANVTRNVLENSRMEYIPLKKEISLLENYLQLQKLRFGERFDYAIHLEEGIDTEAVSISPMLSQPFIENAVEHGMHNITSGGKIDISYSVKSNFLLMEIVDNGHGMNFTNNPANQHQSMAIEITRERLALINKKDKRKTTLEISEAFPDQTERKGVRISFSIPLIQLG